MIPFYQRTLFGLASIAATAATVAFSAPGAAATVGDVPSATVEIADLNLASPSGQAVAVRRIRSAARTVCVSDDRYAAARCRSHAEDLALASLRRRTDDQAAAAGLVAR